MGEKKNRVAVMSVVVKIKCDPSRIVELFLFKNAKYSFLVIVIEE